jgi:hypothetical protein
MLTVVGLTTRDEYILFVEDNVSVPSDEPELVLAPFASGIPTARLILHIPVLLFVILLTLPLAFIVAVFPLKFTHALQAYIGAEPAACKSLVIAE